MQFPDTKSAVTVYRSEAMASQIEIQTADPVPEAVVRRVEAVFKEVESTCTRFGPSPLTKANDEPAQWHRVPRRLYRAIKEAELAYLGTEGLFDPRVHDDLVDLGYFRSFALGQGPVRSVSISKTPSGEWEPRYVPVLRLVKLGGRRVDLGGIGKGLAVRWAAQELGNASANFLINAGGDCFARGEAAPGVPWRVGVEDPAGGSEHVAVLEVGDLSIATSSTRIRRWTNGDRKVHHIINPKTGEPAAGDLQSVTVLHPDPAHAEVWSKVCFLAGSDGIAGVAAERALPVFWVTGSGAVGSSPTMEPNLIWVR